MIGMALGLATKVVGPRFAKPLLILLAVALLIGAFYVMLDKYGDSRYDAGKRDENAAWKAAQDKLLAQAAQATTKADKVALAVTLEHAAKVEEEKEKVDEAIANGGSPLDVLFPRADSVPNR